MHYLLRRGKFHTFLSQGKFEVGTSTVPLGLHRYLRPRIPSWRTECSCSTSGSVPLRTGGIPSHRILQGSHPEHLLHHEERRQSCDDFPPC